MFLAGGLLEIIFCVVCKICKVVICSIDYDAGDVSPWLNRPVSPRNFLQYSVKLLKLIIESDQAIVDNFFVTFKLKYFPYFWPHNCKFPILKIFCLFSKRLPHSLLVPRTCHKKDIFIYIENAHGPS